MKTAHPYLYFNGNSEEAFTFYKSVFGGEFYSLIRYKDFGENKMNVPEEDLNKIANIALPLGNGVILMATDVVESMGKPLTIGNNFYITLDPDSADEAEKLFNALSIGGTVELPLQQTEWAEKHGMVTDKFGIQWMIDYSGNVQYTG